jgi:hypothetical protein
VSQLWVPPKVAQSLKDSTQEHNADIRAMMSFQDPVCAQWSAELQKIDPYLRLARAKENASAPGVIPGFYHFVRLNPGAPVTVMPLHVDGEFAEPTSRMLDTLRQSDLQSTRVRVDRELAERREEEAKERQKARDAEDRQAEMYDRFKAVTQTSVSMNRDQPWSQNVDGRKGVKKS